MRDISSLRRNSARSAFSHASRGLVSPRRGGSGQHVRAPAAASPGPACYDVSHSKSTCSSSSRPTSAVIGKAPRTGYLKPYAYPDVGVTEEAAQSPSGRPPKPPEKKCSSAPRATFGRAAARADGAAGLDLELARACPQASYGQDSPGFIYTPAERPRSAPASFPRAVGARSGAPPRNGKWSTSASPSAAGTPPTVSPASSKADSAFGPQRNSRRRSSSASSFGRAQRFPVSRDPADGELTSECKADRAPIGRRSSSVTFGSAPRECDLGRPHSGYGRAKSGNASDCVGSVSRPRLYHPPIPPQTVLLHYNS